MPPFPCRALHLQTQAWRLEAETKVSPFPAVQAHFNLFPRHPTPEYEQTSVRRLNVRLHVATTLLSHGGEDKESVSFGLIRTTDGTSHEAITCGFLIVQCICSSAASRPTVRVQSTQALLVSGFTIAATVTMPGLFAL